MSDETIFIRVSRALSDTPNGILHSRKQCSVGRTLIRHLPRFLLSFFLTLHLYLSDYVPWLAVNHCQSSMNYTCFCYWFIYSHSPFFSLFSFFFLSSLHLSLLAFIFFVSHFSCIHYLSLLPYFLFSFSELTLLFHPLYSLYSVCFFYASFLFFSQIFLFHSLGCSDSEHRWEPGLPRPPGVVPVRHIQPVPVRSRRRLLLHRPGKCSQHQAARGECSHWHSGGKMGW